eukprot:10555289-Alexandrium_andersonii.AAC.1
MSSRARAARRSAAPPCRLDQTLLICRGRRASLGTALWPRCDRCPARVCCAAAQRSRSRDGWLR